MKTVGIAELKRNLEDIVDEVVETKEPVFLVEKGKVLLRLEPYTSDVHPFHFLRGTGKIIEDVVEPPLPAEAWDAERGVLLNEDEDL